MPPKKISILVSVTGFVLSVSGLFLPWGEREWPPGVMARPNYLLGIELTLGQFALIGCVVTAVSLLLFRIRNQKYSIAFALLGGLITMLCSLAWILNPGALALSGWPPYRVLYGAYVSLIGSILTLLNTIFNFLHQ